MSKYYKVEDVTELITACEWRMTLAKERHGEGFVDYSKQVLDVDELTKRLSNLPTIEVSEDCIYTYCSRCGMRVVANAPSVIPQVPNEDCISKAYLEQEIEQQIMIVNDEHWRGWNNALDKVVELIEDAPSVTTKQSSMVGEWLRKDGRVWSECSACGSGSSFETKFCGNCGAKMKESES